MDRDHAYLLDIVNAAQIALSYVEDVDESEFAKNVQLQDAVIRRLEIIGEAARRVSQEVKVANPEVPWLAIIGMRNFMIHEYDNIDLDIIWSTLKRDIPYLLEQVDKLRNVD